MIDRVHEGLMQLRRFMHERMGGRHTVAIGQRRAGIDALGAALNPVPEDVCVSQGTLGGVPATRFSIADSAPRHHVLYLHGGAFVAGWAISHGSLTADIARFSGAIVHSLEYSLAPEAPFPRAPLDCLAAYRALLESGVEANSIAVAGDSAGGCLALGLLLAVRDTGLPLPSAAALISPALDLTQASSSYERFSSRDPFMSRAGFRADILHYLGNHDPHDPAASPLLADLGGLPPILIQVGSEEVLIGDSLQLAEKLAFARVSARLEIWPDMVHVWHLFPNWLSESVEARQVVAAFFRSKWFPL